ncbi:hypothetical protein BV20DRAFT_546112 [Pilatotrama ljubarskyi]|nr:hypothetical protein BV20DRAFT_546112 [Pilatotrama ljubarskyi]
MPVTLPPEVIVNILNSITDRRTLCSCALTCRLWLPASRYNLFYRLSISRRANFDLLVRVREAAHIAPAFKNVRSLQLWEDQERPWLHLFPLIFSRRLPRMHFLTLGDFVWDKVPLPQSFYTIGHDFPSVSTLKLSDGTFHSFAEFRRLVSAFRQLSRLLVDNVQWRVSPSYYHCDFQPTLPRLELLWFRANATCTVAVPTLVDWLMHTPSVESLNDLQLWEQNGSDLTHIQRLTQALGSRLVHFQVSLRFWTRDHRLSLSSNSSLRDLHIRDIDAASCGFLLPLLDTLSAGNLVQLVLYLRIPTLADLNVLGTIWPEVSNILSLDDFHPLQTLTIWLLKVPPADTLPLQDLMRKLRSWMPVQDSRSVLRIMPWMFLED